ncbi:MAG: class I adenylate-forming enzyme family protein [Planctomycetaceae bacterium]
MNQPSLQTSIETLIVSTESLAQHAESRRPASGASASAAEQLPEAWRTIVARCGERPALVLPAETWSYQRLDRAIAGFAHEMAAQPAFDRERPTILLLPNSVEYVVALLGVFEAGGVAVPLPATIETPRLHTILANCGSRLVVTDGVTAARHGESLRQIGRSTNEASRQLPAAASLATVMFTSGSTGRPKGVMLSHKNLLSNARSIGQCLQITPEERALAVLPFCHAFGNSILLSHLLSGAALVLDGSPLFPETLLKCIRRHSATSLSAVPEIFHALARRTSLGNTPLETLRYMAVAGGALAPQIAVEIARRIRPAQFIVMYGQTEATARLTCLPPDELGRRPGSVGRAIPGVELQVVAETGRPVAPEETGEVRVRGAGVMQGYWGDPQATHEVLRDGWLYTQDLARLDADGFLYLLGRRAGQFKVNGLFVDPREVEAFIERRFPDAQPVAVGFDTPLGKRLALYVRWLSEPAFRPSQDVWRACQMELNRHLAPAHVEIVSEYPLNDALKVDRQRLAARANVAAAQRRECA